MLGWLVFEPSLLTALGYEQDDRHDMREQLMHMPDRTTTGPLTCKQAGMLWMGAG